MALTEVLAMFTMDVSGLLKAAKVSDGAIGAVTGQLKKLGGMLVGGAVLDGLKGMAKELIDQGGALADTSAQLGISTDALQAWQFAAGQGGVSAGEMNKSFLVLEKGMAKAAMGGAKTGGAFSTLGVQLRDAKGAMRSTTDVLTDTGLAIARLKSPQERTAAAMEVFGKAGAKLNPLFSQGEAGLKKMLGEVKRLGGGFSSDAIASLDDLGDQMASFDMAMTSAKVKIFSAFAPAMTELVGWLTGSVAAFASSEQGSAMLTAGITALGIAGAAAGIAFLAPWLPLIAGLTFAGLLVQDFIVGLNGGESLIGRIFDKIFGKGSGETFFVQVKKDIEAAIQTVRDLWDAIQNHGKGDATTRSIAEQSIANSTAASKAQMASPANAFLEKFTEIFRIEGGADKLYESVAENILRSRDREASDGGSMSRGRTFGMSPEEVKANGLESANAIDRADVASVVADLRAGLSEAESGRGTTVGMADGNGNFATWNGNLYSQLFGQSGIMANARGDGGGKGAITQTNQTTINITTSDDPDAIGEAAAGGVSGANRGAADALRRTGG